MLIRADGTVGRQALLSNKLFARQSDCLKFHVKNAGTIALDVNQRRIRIRLRPSTLTERASATLTYTLAEHDRLPTVLDHYDDANDAWNTRIFGCWIDALRWVETLKQEWTVRTRIRHPAEPGTAIGLRAAVAEWRRAGGRVEGTLLGRISRQLLANRFIRLRCDADAFTVIEVGGGLPDFAQAVLTKNVGRQFAIRLDGRYSRDCADYYRHAVLSGEPILQDVDAVVHWVDTGRIRRRYQRLILPLVDPKRLKLEVLSATFEDTTIDLRHGTAV